MKKGLAVVVALFMICVTGQNSFGNLADDLQNLVGNETTYTQADIDAAREEGYQDGYNEGMAAGGNNGGDVGNCATFDMFSGVLRVPCLNMGTSYWLELALRESQPTLKFELVNFGQNGVSNDVPEDPADVPEDPANVPY